MLILIVSAVEITGCMYVIPFGGPPAHEHLASALTTSLRSPATIQFPTRDPADSGWGLTFPKLAVEEPYPDWKRPLKIVSGAYGVAIAAWAALPRETSRFNEAVSLDNFKEGFRRAPHRDADHWVVNYVFHPLAGSETHILARHHGFPLGQAVAFDFLCSVYWEYGPENFFEHPSITDLMITAPVGALLGELRWRAVRKLSRSNHRAARIARLLIDPFGRFYARRNE